jgi:hypothetical protein
MKHGTSSFNVKLKLNCLKIRYSSNSEVSGQG